MINSRVKAMGFKTSGTGNQFKWIGNNNNLSDNEVKRQERRNFCFGERGYVTGVKGVTVDTMLYNIGFCFYSDTLYNSARTEEENQRLFQEECERLHCDNYGLQF